MSENSKDNSTAPLKGHNEAQRDDSSSGQGNAHNLPVDQVNNAQQRQGKSRRRGKKKQKNGPVGNVSSSTVVPDKAESSSGQGNAQSLPAKQDGNTQQPKGKRQRNRKKKKPTETSQQSTAQANFNSAQQSQDQGKQSKEKPVVEFQSNDPIEHPEVANLSALNKAQQSQIQGQNRHRKKKNRRASQLQSFDLDLMLQLLEIQIKKLRLKIFPFQISIMLSKVKVKIINKRSQSFNLDLML